MKLEQEQKAFNNIQENLDIKDTEELRKIIYYLQKENKSLKNKHNFTP